MVKAPVVKEGYVYIAAFALIALIAAYVANIYWSIIPGFLAVYTAFFFRNPRRNVPNDDSLIVSPADGKVMSITEVYDEQFLFGQAQKVTIFLSIFDVHINRSPISGEITFQQYICGRFRPAYKEAAAFENERHTIGITNGRLRIVVIQIAGILARRIVSWATVGSQLNQGQRYGMIKFGSCTEIIMPMNVQVLVKKGDRVKGGETLIGRISE